ncbi:probable transmembrane protein 14C [Coccomyxa sp. Obi]|nr:probable transmembrane protein 14C [Coccomyxa sp. Obi]
MYDFCFTFPYAALLAIGGVIGYLSKGSLPSLLGGVGSGLALGLAAQTSLNQYHQGKLCKPATFASLLISASLTAVMYKRFLTTGKFMPAGMVALMSALMTVFYVWNLLAMKPPSSIRSA